jgi:hypothetical protein
MLKVTAPATLASAPDSSRCKEIQRFYRNTEDLPETERNWMRTYFRGADTASAPAGQLALDQEPDAGELVKALESIEQTLDVDDGTSYVSDDPHGAIVTAYDTARTALAAWKGGVK